MAVCLVMQFAGVDAGKYEEVMEELRLRGDKPDWPSGIISHVAGFTSDGMYVVDVWESQEDFDAFVESRLMPAFDAVGGVPQPQITTFEVHNDYAA
jgi:heme-degrading monooxygenase HmoA